MAGQAGNINIKIGADISDLQSKTRQATREVSKFQNSTRLVGIGINRIGNALGQSAAVVSGFFGTMAAGAAGSAFAIAKAASDFESAFAGTKKVLEGTDAQFAELSKGIRNMSKEIPMSAVEIASLAEKAGQLGIAREDVLDFTRTVADLGVATNMSAEDASEAFARFANITNMPIKNVDRLGSTVVELGLGKSPYVAKVA